LPSNCSQTVGLLKKLGANPGGSTPEQLAEDQKADTAKWVKVIKTADIELD
jgi:hypothetical protein